MKPGIRLREVPIVAGAAAALGLVAVWIDLRWSRYLRETGGRA